jgi:hypothetical protein
MMSTLGRIQSFLRMAAIVALAMASGNAFAERLEFSKSAAFDKLSHTTKSNGGDFALEKGEPGVWHWRMRAERDESELFKGSLILIAPKRAEDKKTHVRIKWPAQKGARSYNVVIREGRGEPTMIRTERPEFALQLSKDFICLTVQRAEAGADKSMLASMFLDGLYASGTGKFSAEKNSLLTVADQSAAKAPPTATPIASQPVVQSVTAPSPSSPTESLDLSSSSELRRSFLSLSTSVLGGFEKFRAQKSELGLKHQTAMAGYAIDLESDWSRYVTVKADIQMYQASIYVAPSATQAGIEQDEGRVHGDVRAEIHTLRQSQKFFALGGPSAAFSRFSSLPTNYDASQNLAPELLARERAYAGLSFGLGYIFSRRFMMTSSANLLRGEDRSEKRQDIDLEARWTFKYSSLTMAINDRRISSESCDGLASVCEREGKVRTKLESQHLVVGAGLNL